MRERKRKLGEFPVEIHLFTWRDKFRPMFRARNPDCHIVELTVGCCIVRTWTFEKPTDATAQFEHLLGALK